MRSGFEVLIYVFYSFSNCRLIMCVMCFVTKYVLMVLIADSLGIFFYFKTERKCFVYGK